MSRYCWYGQTLDGSSVKIDLTGEKLEELKNEWAFKSWIFKVDDDFCHDTLKQAFPTPPPKGHVWMWLMERYPLVWTNTDQEATILTVHDVAASI